MHRLLAVLFLLFLSCTTTLPEEEVVETLTPPDSLLSGEIFDSIFQFDSGKVILARTAVVCSLFDISSVVDTIDSTDTTDTPTRPLTVVIRSPRDTMAHQIGWNCFVTVSGGFLTEEYELTGGAIQLYEDTLYSDYTVRDTVVNDSLYSFYTVKDSIWGGIDVRLDNDIALKGFFWCTK